MLDQEHREIKYLRLSVTDSCNFRCMYCMDDKTQYDFHTLSIDNIKLIVSNLNKLGIEKVKITGGEPLVREDIALVVRVLKEECNIKEVTLTTNGVLIDKYLTDLEDAGLDAITVSIDTLDKDKFNKITRRKSFDTVINNIKLLSNSSIKNIKLNTVPLKEFGESNIIELCKFSKEFNMPIRFIEMMPIGLGKKMQSYDNNSLLEIISKEFGPYTLSDKVYGNGPATYYNFANLNINVGLISALSNKFCESCNKIRVTSNGHLKQCLHYNYNIDLVSTLKEKSGLEKVKEFVYQKPKEHAFKDKSIDKEKLETLHMSEIGG
ncbi:MAG: GTP 3',8-cyclase MoaA [Mycoplasmatales bacterium]